MNPTPNTYDAGPISTIFGALDEKQRKKLESAIITRNHSLVKIHEIFHLAEAGISQQTLYRYARRVRDQADKEQLLEKCLADEVDIDAAIFKYIKRQTLEILMHRDPNMLDVTRASLTMRRCQITLAAQSNSKSKIQNLKSPAPNPKSWGTNEDGTEMTHAQFMAKFKRVLFEEYAPKSVKEDPAARAAFFLSPDIPPRAPAPDQSPERKRAGELLTNASHSAFARNPTIDPRSCENPFSHVPSRESLPAPTDQNRERQRPERSATPCEITHQSSEFDDPSSKTHDLGLKSLRNPQSKPWCKVTHDDPPDDEPGIITLPARGR